MNNAQIPLTEEYAGRPVGTATPGLDADRQRQAKEYALQRRYLFGAELAVGGLYLLAAIVTGFSARLAGWASSLSGSPWLVVALYTAMFFLIYTALIFPLNLLGGFIWPHRYGLSRQTLRAWLWDQLKGLLLGLAFGLLLIEVLYAFLRADPTWWWLWTSLVYLLFTVVLSNLAPLIILPLFFKLKPLEDAELARRLTTLAERAGARVRGVYTMDMSSKTTQANAALMGLGNTRRIVLGDTMLQDYTPDEIETVLAHELGHHVHGDIGKGIALETLSTLVGLWLAGLLMAWLVTRLGLRGIADPAAMPVLGLVLGLFGLITLPITNGFSRWRESMADDYALRTTGRPEAFANAMIRLANQNLADAEPQRWVEVLLYSHPAISRRVARARSFETTTQTGLETG